jgi:hypothetical protein
MYARMYAALHRPQLLRFVGLPCSSQVLGKKRSCLNDLSFFYI